ncbi:DUF418 domain-containing protein [Salinicoccus halodurans]|uniref:DUF418 domain-containing protein n=1 Tax=Salinicoccus halodurans TaxID=407035 RepID=A0A0F7HLQ6_9STAP|nr:DUF418 domain-containing protein [Salinicoccus halodurans]AKG74281.1 hypothetical protein AAT16_08585 [Salinicoccus halodurans]SFK93959.1 uncharacterized protein SAMN05216235_2614 [Salinicoccus halodurans]
MSQNYSPIDLSERVHEIDAVRGFALLGILMMNIMSFAGPTLQDQFSGGPSDIYTGGMNSGVIFFINTFVTSNFYTMFSFLFGLGFYIFLSRADKKPGSTSALFIRRMMMLLAFGIFHAIFIWYGDILTVYAVTGIILLIFYRIKPAVNLAISISIFTLGTIFIAVMSLLLYAAGVMGTNEAQPVDPGFDMIESLTNAGYMDVIDLNMSVLGIMMSSNIVMIPLVLAMFLIGLYAGQKKLFENLGSKTKLLIWTAVVGLGIGTPVKIFVGYGLTYMMQEPVWSILTMLAYTLGGPLMSLGYVALFVLIARKVKGLTKLLQPVGQMALTNYIMQSVIMTSFFYGLNLFNQIDAVWFIPIVLTVFIIQIIYSHLWMKVFKFGPLEWVWRTVTYGKTMPIKR